jgi:hypothetical protein
MEEQKPWYQSKTVLSAIIAIVGVVAPKYLPIVNEYAGDILVVIGMAGAIVGRMVAKKGVTLKKPTEEKAPEQS